MNSNRVRTIKEGPFAEGPVAYWMSREQRAFDNWALLWAQQEACRRNAPLFVIFCLVEDFLKATQRQYMFMIKGLREVERRLLEKNIPFQLLLGTPGIAIPEWIRANDIKLLVTDFDPLRIKKEWKKLVSDRIDIPFCEVDAHNIIPCWVASPRKEYAAYTLRPRLNRMLDEYLVEFPELVNHPLSVGTNSPTDWEEVIDGLTLDETVEEVAWIVPGEKEARDFLAAFIEKGLPHYNETRNDPARKGQSGLSPYLHFGQLSSQRVALEVIASKTIEETKKAFLEELIVRRELADNFCLYEPDYDKFSAFPAWAQQTLNAHRDDPRPYLYSRQQLEYADTHDELWNAAQQEMTKTGKMHGYMRMYWAKKILEWTISPEEALETSIYLNDRYELDGRDPSGYAGIAWSIGGVHDRAWGDRMVLGKIRYMSYNGCRGKFKIKKYVELVLRKR